MPATLNRLIEQLPRRDRSALLAASQTVPLVLGAVLWQPDAAVRHVYFPDEGFISLVTAIRGEPGLEVGMVGREGMLGVHLALGARIAPLLALVQGAGSARRIGAGAFRRTLVSSQALQAQLHRYACVLMAQLATGAACTRFHQVGPRLARWLLMSHDQAETAQFRLTHEFMAYMLGVRRAGVTRAAGDLQRHGLIRYHRGEMTVLDRAGLEAAACGCYAADRTAYERVLGRARTVTTTRPSIPNQETTMSKGQRGNKEAKKPKKMPAPATPLAPSVGPTASAPRPQRRK